MRNIKLTLEYDGTNYCGWQVQNDRQRTETREQKPENRIRFKKRAIQEVIEKALQRILQEKIKIIASGRTDSGVHASAQVANFRTKSKIPPQNIRRALNTYLPDDIAVINIEEIPLKFHSRFDARSKAYRYTILNRENPSALCRDFACHIRRKLDFNLMKRESRCLVGKHNFKSFQAQDKKEMASVRTIKRLRLSRSGDFINIEIEADGFLYNMVRNIIGTLVEIGRGRIKKGELKKILSAKNRKLAGPTAPAKGLCLIEVNYGK